MSGENPTYPRSIAEVPQFYDAQLRAVEAPYAQILQSLGDWPNAAELAYGQPVEVRLQEIVEQVHTALGQRTSQYVDVIGAIPDVVMDMPDFSTREHNMLNAALRRLSLPVALAEISTLSIADEVRMAMRISVDPYVLDKASRSLSAGVAMRFSDAYGATRASRRAMRASLDAKIFREAGRKVSYRGTHEVINSFAATGEPYVTHAMRTLVDARVLRNAASALRENSGRMTIQSGATSQAAGRWMLHSLYGDPITPPRGNAQGNRRSQQAFNDQDTRIHPPRGQHQAEATPSVVSQEEQDRQLYTSVIEKVPLSVARTLDSMTREEVLKVVRTIHKIREHAASKDIEVSDREIYLRFARRSNNAAEATPEHVRSTQIAQLLLADKNTFVL